MYVCVGANVSIGFIESVFLYDATSKSAIIAGIAQSTGIPYIDITYDKDTSLLCPVSDNEDESVSVLSGDSAGHDHRVLATDTSTLNFALRKPLLRKSIFHFIYLQNCFL